MERHAVDVERAAHAERVARGDGVGTYEAGVALGTQARHAKIAAAAASATAAEQVRAANTDNGRLIFGAALAVHALMLVVALVTALAFSLIVRQLPAPESKT